MDTTTHDASLAGHAPPPPPARPPLRRRRDDRILGGVAGGIADHLAVDVALVRIVLVVLGLLNGLGVLLYLIAWVAVPEAEHDHAPTTSTPAVDLGGRTPLFWVGVSLLVLGALALVTGPLALLPGVSAPQLLVPLVLIGFGLALWRAGEDEGPRPDEVPPPPPPARRDSTAAVGVSASPTTPPGYAASVQTPRAEAPDSVSEPHAAGVGGPGEEGPRRPREAGPAPSGPDESRSWVTRATLGLVLVVVGLLWILQLVGVAALGVATMLAAALLVVGMGLLVGSVVGGGRWLLLAGGLLLPLVLLAQATGPGMAALVGAWDPGEDGRAVGQLLLAPGDLDELEPSYRLGAGSFELDLTGVGFEREPTVVEVEVGAGQILVIVPDDVDLVAVGQAGIGQVELFDERVSGGFGPGPLRGERTPEPSAGSLELHLSAGVGQVVVATAPAS